MSRYDDNDEFDRWIDEMDEADTRWWNDHSWALEKRTKSPVSKVTYDPILNGYHKYHNQIDEFNIVARNEKYSCWIRGIEKTEPSIPIDVFQKDITVEVKQELSNQLNPNSISVHAKGYGKIGYIPENDARWMSQLIDQGFPLKLYLLQIYISDGKITKVEIGIESRAFKTYYDNYENNK